MKVLRFKTEEQSHMYSFLSFSKYLLNSFYVLSIVRKAGGTTEN